MDVLDFDITTDCWVTARMLLNVFNQGDREVNVSLYHLESANFGYHEFAVLYPMNIKQIDKDILNNFAILNHEERVRTISDMLKIDLSLHAKLSSVNITLYYSYDTVLNPHF